ncbi:MAG: hypothetical protein LBS01_06800 [Prevotellaceae bacterium]|jgi:hypothetical protein|nr:hypothetical protein [Prevotellaceae bacterium]
MKLASIIAVALFSCNGCAIKKHRASNILPMEITAQFSISPKTKLFLSHLNRELKASGKPISEFIPSEELTDKYVISKTNGMFYISGVLSVQQNFDFDTLDSVGVIYGFTVINTVPVHIPLTGLHDFFKLSNITYFEISKPLNSY